MLSFVINSTKWISIFVYHKEQSIKWVNLISHNGISDIHPGWPHKPQRNHNATLFTSLHIRSMWETICDAKHIPVHILQTVNFCPNFPESPFLEFQTRKPPPPFQNTSYLRWPKCTLKYPPISENFRFEMTSLLRNTPPIWENCRFEMTKVYSEIPHFGKLQI